MSQISFNRHFRNNKHRSILDPAWWIQSILDKTNQYLDNLLEMNHHMAAIRQQMVFFSALILWALIGIANLSLQEWQDFQNSVLPGFAPPDTYMIDIFRSLALFIFQTFFSANVLGSLLAIYFPFWFARKAAAIYVSEIFEQEEAISDRFINQAAFANRGYDTIHIEEGQVRQEDRKSPVFRIGGPGNVQVGLENVAVFEQVNGEFEIVGPTVNQPNNTYTLKGFERLRKIIDLRDHTMLIENITSRTKDGIQLSIKNMQVLFSVDRGDEQNKRIDNPYPFTENAIESIVYQQPSGAWVTPLKELIRLETINIISEHTLAELVASIGEPEIKNQITLESTIQKQIWDQNSRKKKKKFKSKIYHPFLWKKNKLRIMALPFVNTKHMKQMRPNKRRDLIREDIKQPSFFRRSSIRDIFIPSPTIYNDFKRRAKEKGVTLEWIDIGTWHLPKENFLDQHIEAWKLTNENLMRGNPKVLEEIENKNEAFQISEIIQENIAIPFYQLLRDDKNKSDEIIYQTINSIFRLIRVVHDRYMEQEIPIPRRMISAMHVIQKYQRNYIENNEKGIYLN